MQITKLPNGLRVITDEMNHLKTLYMGIWIKVGSRFEALEEHGIAHLLEHMAFKGTSKRSYQDIAEQVEDVGGIMNAYTSREQTAYYMRILSEDAELCADILGDILQNSIFDENELVQEKNVILQEIGEADDQPDDVMFDRLQSISYPDQALGRPILGTHKSVQDMTRQQIIDYISRHYVPENIIFAASGNITQDKMISLAEKYLCFPDKKPAPLKEISHWQGGNVFIQRDLEQLHLAISFNSVSYLDDDYYIAEIFSIIYGGGMSSHLFQEIRERRGLVYSISSFTNMFKDCGTLTIYAGTSPQKGPEVITAILETLEKTTHNITQAELKRAKAQIRAGLLMSLENPSSRCETLVKQQFIFGKFISTDDILTAVDKITLEDLFNFSKTITKKNKMAFAAIGNLEGIKSDIEDILSSHSH